MKSFELIELKLNEFVTRFPQISFLYEFDEAEQTHIVEVRPLKIYEEDEAYKEAEGEFTYIFDRKFSPESLMFVSEDSLIRVTKQTRVFENKQNVFINDETFEVTFQNSNEGLNKSLILEPELDIDSPIEDFSFSFQDKDQATDNEVKKNDYKNYALAA